MLPEDTRVIGHTKTTTQTTRGKVWQPNGENCCPFFGFEQNYLHDKKTLWTTSYNVSFTS